MLETEKELKKFRDYVIKESRTNLTKLKKNSSKKLYNSLKGEYKLMANSFSLYFSMEDYGTFQDKGVNGKFKQYGAPYSYTNKMPPPSKLDKWIVRKGIAPKDKQGKFISRKSLQFLIARSIYRNGIKPSLFFTKPFESAYKRLPEELVVKYGLDAISLFNLTVEQPKKK